MALMNNRSQVLRAGRPMKNRAGRNRIEPSAMAHQVAMYFSPACLSSRFQAVCRMAEPKSNASAASGIQVLFFHAGCRFHFKYLPLRSQAKPFSCPALRRDVLNAADAAMRSGGVRLVPEPEEGGHLL